VSLAALGLMVGLMGLDPAPMLPTLPPPPPRSVTVSIAGALQRQPSDEMDAVYGTTHPFEIEVRGGAWWGERVGVGIVGGVQRRVGEGIAPKAPTPTTVLWQIPLAVEGRLRMALHDGQPVVPLVRAGLGVVGAIETWTVEEGDSGEWRGFKAAVHVAGGFQIRMPFPELSFGGPRFTEIRGPQDLYLQVEGRLRSAADFGRGGLDLSGAGVVIGLTFLL
jgi:hypothetical protein